MNAKEVRSMTNAEMANKLDDMYQELFNLRFQAVTGKLTNTARFRAVRKDVARIKTVLRERELAE
jgi:large subunit ribosomal protein L29